MSTSDMRSSVGLRLVIVVVLTFALLVPALMIRALIIERKERRDSVANEISDSWGGRQTLVGPILTIPFERKHYNEQRERMETIQYAHFLPQKLTMKGRIDPEKRNRGIYDIVVYNSIVDVAATFSAPDLDGLSIEPETVLWDAATVSFGITDMKGITRQVQMEWNGAVLEAEPGVSSEDVIKSGVSIPVSFSEAVPEYSFSTSLDLNGSFGMFVAPVGKETAVHLESSWQNPSFSGGFLPAERSLTEAGFTSDWRILHVSRDFPQQWVGSRYDVADVNFGVNLLLGVDQYQQTMRTIKYAIMFIALTFLTFFVIEILSARPIHPIQYLLIGLALLIFYTLLLSLSEYIPFKFAYLAASVAIVSMITMYSRSVVADGAKVGIVAAILGLLYAYLYIILQLQDYALLMGTIILFIALAAMMYLTRKVDWFSALDSSKQRLEKNPIQPPQ